MKRGAVVVGVAGALAVVPQLATAGNVESQVVPQVTKSQVVSQVSRSQVVRAGLVRSAVVRPALVESALVESALVRPAALYPHKVSVAQRLKGKLRR